MARDVDYRKPPTSLGEGFKIRLDEDLYGLLAGVHFHSDRCVAKIYLMATTVLASNNRMRHILSPIEGISQIILLVCKRVRLSPNIIATTPQTGANSTTTPESTAKVFARQTRIGVIVN